MGKGFWERAGALTALWIAGGGGAGAWLLAWAGHPWAGLALWVLGLGGAAQYALRQTQQKGEPTSVSELLLEVAARPDHPQASVAADIQALLERVEAYGKSIRQVVRHLQEHATLVAWVIDTLNQAVTWARGGLGSMQDAFRSVEDHAGEVLKASLKGAEFMEAMGGRTEELFQSTETLNGSVEEATSSVVQIHGALSNIQLGVSLLSEASDRTTEFISQVGRAMGAIRESTDQSLNVSQKVQEHARKGRETVARVGAGVEEIRRSSLGMVQSVQALGNQSKEIEGILGIITDVAEETSLLSLNAAILAAQAGDKGAAFAVVADQIRSLAHRTRQSTKDIEDLIRGIQANITEANLGLERNLEAVEDGGKMGREAVRQLELIEGAVADSVGQARRISQAAQEQDEKSLAMVDAAAEVNSNLHQVAENLGQSIHQMGGIQALIQSLASLSLAVRGASEEHRDTGRKTRELMGSLSTQVEGIHRLLDHQTETTANLAQALSQVAESSDSTRESLEMIHTIVNELVAQSDHLQEEMKGLRSEEQSSAGE